MTNYDVVVLGAGSGGYATALRAAQLGLSVALIEKDKVGGTCLHRGCIPTKAFLHAAEVADNARDGAQFGVMSTLEGVNLAKVREYAEGVIARLYKGLTGLVKGRGVTTIEGEGRLVKTGEGVAVDVGGEQITGTYTVLATGSSSRTLGLDVDGERILTSEHALQLTTMPTSAIVLGGGVIGVEFASAWRSYGIDVTIVEALDRLVSNEEPEISKVVTRTFKKRGINVITGTGMEKVEKTGSGVVMTLADGRTVEADLCLVAVGRGPNSEGMGYEECGVALDRGCVVVDETLKTSLDRVYAVGDLVRGPQLAHRGFMHGIYLAETFAKALGRYDGDPQLVPDANVPKITYCEPEIASIGLTEEAAKVNGEVECMTYDLGGNGRSQILKTQGFVKLVRMKDGPIVGVHMVGSGMSEQIGEAQLMVSWEADPADLAPLIHGHPSQNEALGEAALALAGKPLHAHG